MQGCLQAELHCPMSGEKETKSSELNPYFTKGNLARVQPQCTLVLFLTEIYFPMFSVCHWKVGPREIIFCLLLHPLSDLCVTHV